MRNLIVIGERRRSVRINHLPDEEVDRVSPCDLCSFQSECGTESATVVMTAEGILVRVSDKGEAIWVCRLDQVCPGGKWFNVTYVDSIDALVCLSHGGGIVTVSPASGEAELVGEFDHGLETGRWSPDGEVLVLVTFSENDEDSNTRNSILLTMSGQWEVLSEVTMETHVPSSNDTLDHNTAVSVCWRPDGTACAVSAVDVHDQKRRIRTYERDTLSLKSIGRTEDGSGKLVPALLYQLAWASGGCSHVLASVQKKGKRTMQVVFFEPNGLRHREFVLRPNGTEQPQPLGLCWNVESNLLAVTLRESTSDLIQLWHRSNYHWYLKQELRFPEKSRVSCAMFHEEQPYKLFVLLQQDDSTARQVEWRDMDFCWDPSTVAMSLAYSNSCTAVAIDGCIMNTTPLDRALVPPPMYASSLTMDRPIRGVSFVREQPVSFLLQLSDGNLVLVGNNGGEPSSTIANYTTPSVAAKIVWENNDSVGILPLRNLLVMGGTYKSISNMEFQVVALHCPSVNGVCENLVEISIVVDREGEGTARVTNTTPLEGRVLRMIPWSNASQGALLQLDDGSLLEYDPIGGVIPSDVDSLLEPCPWFAAMKNIPHDQSRQKLVVGLSSRSRLFCHDRLLADAVSSFVLSPTHGFLCYATSGSHCQLRLLPLSELLTFDPLMGSDENHLLAGYEPRNLERGSRLVAVLPNHPTAILQLPRGNMEGVYPRALVLPFVMSKIDVEEYGVAFEMMRRQRVDLNLIVDMNPHHFLRVGANNFLAQVQDIDYLNLFIATLQDFDITEWKYKVPTWFRRVSKSDEDKFGYATKVNQVCGVLREIMIRSQKDGRHSDKGGDHFLLPILSTFAKENPPKLEEALKLIKENALVAHPPTSKKPPLFSERAQSSIQYLAFLADYELLFSTALGMYDYELARAVARNSQMDPKVYLPLLKRLRTMDTFYGRYEVDVRLKRYEHALSNLFRSGANQESLEGVTPTDGVDLGNEFDHCMAFIKEHKLHRLGLELYQARDEERNCIMLSLGEQLMQDSHSESALAVFLAVEPPNVEGAKRAARACGDWRVFFTLSIDDTVSGNKESIQLRRRAIASEVAEEIAAGKGGKRGRQEGLVEAGRILLDYGHDVVGAVDMFVSAEKWSEARRIASLHLRQDLEKKTVDAAVSYAHSLLLEFEDRAAAFEKANDRYREVLKIRREAAANFDAEAGDADNSHLDDSGSLFSMASNDSNMSLRSNMSSGSVGSVSSVSSVISVGATSSFSITSERDVNKHKSKFNKVGKAKKTKKKKSGKKKMKPGSEEELKSLTGTLKANVIDNEYRDAIAETIQFIVHAGKLSLAQELYKGYNSLRAAVESSQHKSTTTARQQREEAERNARTEGTHHEQVVLPVEGEVDSLQCEELPEVLRNIFSFL